MFPSVVAVITTLDYIPSFVTTIIGESKKSRGDDMDKTIDDKVGNPAKSKLLDKVAIDLGFIPDNYYSAKDKMALQMREDGALARTRHMHS